ncbi:hypothetical protein, partial [Escherichia coli]|uniref:hypothetical protein n=1 Tax=Escherichia coli TaxID=562 RepID=UPI001B7D77B7
RSTQYVYSSAASDVYKRQPIDTPQNNPHKRRVNHFAVFVPQPFRAIDKLAVRESHEVRTYTNSP